MEAANAAALLHRTLGRDERAASWRRQGLTEVQATAVAAAAAAVAAPDNGGGDNGGRVGALQADGDGGLLASGAYDWRQLSHSLHTSGHAVIDRVLGGGAASPSLPELQNLEPLMRQGRVGHGVQSGAVRTDVLWRHKRGEGTVVNSTAPHMAALHALFDALPLGLNGVDGGGPAGGGEAGTCAADAPRLASPAWALTHAEDLQFACYHPGGYYRRHSDAQNASRRVLTAIYYPNGAWRPSDGGRLRLYLPRRARAAAGVGGKARRRRRRRRRRRVGARWRGPLRRTWMSTRSPTASSSSTAASSTRCCRSPPPDPPPPDPPRRSRRKSGQEGGQEGKVKGEADGRGGATAALRVHPVVPGPGAAAARQRRDASATDRAFRFQLSRSTLTVDPPTSQPARCNHHQL